MSFRGLFSLYFGTTVLVGWALSPISLTNPTLQAEFGPDYDIGLAAVERAFLLYAIAFAAFLAGTAVPVAWRARPCPPRSLPSPTFRVMLLAVYSAVGVGGLTSVLLRLGAIPLFMDDPLSAKHFLQISEAFAVEKPLYMISYTILYTSTAFSLALLIDVFRYRPSAGFIVLGLFGLDLAALLLTMKRKLILFPFYVVAVSAFLLGRIGWRPVAGAGLVLVSVGIAAEYVGGIHDAGGQLVTDFVYRVANNLFVEPREFARVLFQWAMADSGRLYGMSYVAALLGVVPSSASATKQEFDLGRLTLRTLGYEGHAGGIPRIGFVGEAYLNFGLVGVVLIAFIFGVTVRVISRHFEALREARPEKGQLFRMVVSYTIFGEFALGIFGSGSSQLAFTVLTALLAWPLVDGRWEALLGSLVRPGGRSVDENSTRLGAEVVDVAAGR